MLLQLEDIFTTQSVRERIKRPICIKGSLRVVSNGAVAPILPLLYNYPRFASQMCVCQSVWRTWVKLPPNCLHGTVRHNIWSQMAFQRGRSSVYPLQSRSPAQSTLSCKQACEPETETGTISFLLLLSNSRSSLSATHRHVLYQLHCNALLCWLKRMASIDKVCLSQFGILLALPWFSVWAALIVSQWWQVTMRQHTKSNKMIQHLITLYDFNLEWLKSDFKKTCVRMKERKIKRSICNAVNLAQCNETNTIISFFSFCIWIWTFPILGTFT